MTSVLIAVHDPARAKLWHRELHGQGPWTLMLPVHSLAEARRRFITDPPSLLVADLQFQDGSLLELIETLPHGAQANRPQVLALVRDEADPLLLDALQAGADNFFMTAHAQPGRLAAHVRATLSGGADIAPWIARHLLDFFGFASRHANLDAVENLVNPLTLTRWECSLLRQLSVGAQMAQLALKEGIGPLELAARVRAIHRKKQWAQRAGNLSLS